MERDSAFGLALILSLALLVSCAAPAPTATPTQPAVAVTPTKAPTATPTKRPITKLTLAYADVSTSYLPAWVARSLGYYEQEGLDIDWVQTGSGAKALAAVVGGSAPVGYTAASEVMAAISQGQPIQVIGSLMLRGSQKLTIRKEVAAAKGITEKSPLTDVVKALRGLTIATSSPGRGGD
ncbi:MAG: ABC transporter substrate-binding protein, partial [Chloroflexi bacterium]|nr:ABC transporter substrate-binding protein [Chloroflexota bacterium]